MEGRDNHMIRFIGDGGDADHGLFQKGKMDFSQREHFEGPVFAKSEITI